MRWKRKRQRRGKEETTLAKVTTKQKRKLKVVEKQKMEKTRRKRLDCVTIVESWDTLKKSVGRKILHKCLRNFEGRNRKGRSGI